uniref:SC protease n=1 Tax=Bacillus sp. KSM-LD1 TaxID=196381 RepID=Q4W8M2_9BACI|nr:SC protease [Bacillus sp. KSM-LD1]
MRRKMSVYKVFMLMLCLLLIAPSFMSVSASTTKGVSVAVNDSKEIAAAKISKTLNDQFNKDEKVTFLIKFKEQVDTMAIAKQVENEATVQAVTAAQTKLMKRNVLVSELRSTAISTQADVKAYLEKQEAAGNAKDIQSFFIVNGMAVTATKEVMEKIASFPEVEMITPNEEVQLYPSVEAPAGTTENDKNTPTNDNVEWNIQQVGAPQAWEMGVDGQGAVVAVMDTGVQWNHPALMQQYRGFDPANPNSPTHTYSFFDAVSGQSAAYDDHGHGTHVAGTAVGGEQNGTNQIGVAPGAKWIGVKILNASGSGSQAQILNGAQWLLAPTDANGNPNPAMAPDIVNNSWGGGAGMNEWFRPMVQAWRAADIYPVFAAGNTTLTNPGGPGSVAVPANYPESYAVGATDVNMNLGSFSLQGPSPYGEMKPEVSAPGVNIRSATPGSNYQGGWNGTSMAAPHVAGAVALLKQVNSSLSIDEIAEILENTATPRTNAQYPEAPNNGFGHGIINVHDAVSSIISGLGKIKGQVVRDGEDDEAPTFEHTAPAETYAGMALPLSIDVQDNVSITSVTLQYENAEGEWVDVEATRTSGTYNNATYQAAIPGDEIAVPSVSYKFHVVDFGGNEVTTDTYEVSVQPGISIGYFQDFESDPIGWYSFGDNNSWQWGVPTSGPNGAYSGEKVYATNLAGNYDNRANMTLVMPPVELPEDSEAYLQYKSWHNLETRWDFGHVFVSTDGGETWTQAYRFDDVTNGWVDREVDLSQYAGQTILVGFNVTTDGSVVRVGWYLDDVQLSDEPLADGETAIAITKEDNNVAAKDEKVDPDKIVPAGSLVDFNKVNDSAVNTSGLPLNAQVTVVESNRSVNTNPANGQYELLHAAGEFTVKAEAYGYYPAEQSVNIPADGEATANFVLDEIPQGTVTGVVTNSATGNPVADATLLLVEDAAIAPVETDENGAFTISAYEGEYTLRVMAPSFYSEDVTITVEGNSSTEQNISLRPFIGYPGEIGYDDGTAENARAFYDAGNGWAVKMSLPEGHSQALVTGGLFRFWDTSWPTPGGTDFQVAVYDATGPDGSPGNRLAGPISATALRTGEWTNVDLSEHGIIVNQDFYMVYIQSHPNPNAPGLGTDEDGPNAGRSWQLVGGAWSPSPEAEGNYMIRATVNFEVTPPTVTSPVDGTFTNQEVVTVEGSAAPTTTVHVLNNGEEVAEVATSDQGTFNVDIELQQGVNVLTTKASTANGTTEESEPITVVLDQEAPELAITSPENNSKTNRETVTVTGTVSDENLDFVKVNGRDVAVNDGQYSQRVMLENGENIITVVAQDKAGNSTEASVVVDAKYTAPAITNLAPTDDVYLRAGESVKIEFNSDPGLDATFTIRMPLTNTNADLYNQELYNAMELPLREVSPGYYVGYWTATSSVQAFGAEIEVKVQDDYSNVTRQIAEGKLFINVSNGGDDRPGNPNPGRPDNPGKGKGRN